MSTVLFRARFALATAASVAVFPLAAQTPPSSSPSPSSTPPSAPVPKASSVAELPEVLVTATRTPQALSDAPASATLLGRSAIDQRNVARASDVLAPVPGLYLSASGNGQSASFTGNFSLRGMDAGRTLVLIDGVQPLQNANSQRVNWQTVLMDDVQQVEVAPGPFAALYGSNAVGGVVNFISKPLDQREITLRVKKGFGDAAGQDGSLYVRNTLESGLGFAFGVSRSLRDGYVNEFAVREPVAGAAGIPVSGAIPTTTTTGAPAYLVGDRGRQPWQQSNALLRLSYALDAQSKVSLGMGYFDALADYTRFNSYLTRNTTGAPVVSGTLGIDGRRVTLTEANFLGNTPLTESGRRWFAGYEGVLQNDVKLKLDVAGIERSSRFPSAGAAAGWNSGAGTLTSAPDRGTDASAVVQVPVGADHIVVAGLATHRDSVDRTSSNLANWRDATTVTSVRERYFGRSDTNSVFVQDEYQVNPSFIAYIGGRLDRWETSGDYQGFTAPASSADYPKRGTTAFSPKVSGVWSVSEPWTLRASWGRSFRAPSIFEMYSTSRSSSGVLTQGDPDLKPESGNTWELGADWKVNKGLGLRASVYQTELDDLIYRKSITPTLIQRSNAGKTRVQGLELGSKAQLLSWLQLNAHASWIQSEVLQNPADPASVGKRLADSPDHVAFVGLTAQHGVWSGQLDVQYTGKVFSTSGNTDTATTVFGSYDGYTLVNAKLGYAWSRNAKLNLSLNNLTDLVYFQFGQMPRRNATLEWVLSF